MMRSLVALLVSSVMLAGCVGQGDMAPRVSSTPLLDSYGFSPWTSIDVDFLVVEVDVEVLDAPSGWAPNILDAGPYLKLDPEARTIETSLPSDYVLIREGDGVVMTHATVGFGADSVETAGRYFAPPGFFVRFEALGVEGHADPHGAAMFMFGTRDAGAGWAIGPGATHEQEVTLRVAGLLTEDGMMRPSMQEARGTLRATHWGATTMQASSFLLDLWDAEGAVEFEAWFREWLRRDLGQTRS